MPFTDDEVLLLLDLDFDLPEVVAPTRWARLCSAAWWVTFAVGSLAGMYLVLQADYGFHPTRFGG
jgi:hypothetical protein